MKTLLEWLGFCRHQFETINSNAIYFDDAKVGTLFVIRCKHCGDIKRKRVMAT